MKYICDECDIEMSETTLLQDMNWENTTDSISLCCTKCRKWAIVPKE